MKRSSSNSVGLFRLRSHRSATVSCSAIALFSVLAACAGLAQTQVRHSPPTQKAAAAPTELDKRLAAARAARDSGDPAAAQLANERLIAAALSELARLRLIEKIYPQAVELYSSFSRI